MKRVHFLSSPLKAGLLWQLGLRAFTAVISQHWDSITGIAREQTAMETFA